MKRQSGSILKILPNLLFILVIMAFGGYILATSFTYQFRTAAFAGFASAVLVILSVILLVRDIRRALAEKATEADNTPQKAKKGLAIPLLWTVGFLAGILLIGIVWTVPIWIFIYLIVHKLRIVAVAGSLIM
jgi:hypothetical protein